MAKILTLIAGILAVILPNLGQFDLPANVQGVITGIGGILLGILAVLEHPTVKTVAAAKAAALSRPSSAP